MIWKVAAIVLLATTSLAQARELTGAEKSLVSKSLARNLKDPQAAQFRWLPFTPDASGATPYCGMVNGKNSYGAYIGFVPFQAMVMTKQGKITGATMLAFGPPNTTEGQVAQMACARDGMNPQLAR